jgi:PAS domain S-box-containing protein
MATSPARDVRPDDQAEGDRLLKAHQLQMERMPFACIICDAASAILSWNPAAERIFGYTAGEAVGRTTLDLLAPRPSPSPGREAHARPAEWEGGPPADAPIEHRTKSGRTIVCRWYSTPLDSEGNGVTGSLLMAEEITERVRSEERQALLAEAGRILGSSLDYRATVGDLCRLVVPALADWCSLDLLGEFGEVHRLDVHHKDSAKGALAREYRRRYPPRPEDKRGLMGVLRTGEPELIRELSDGLLAEGARDAEHLALLRELGPRSILILPLTARGRTLGAMTLVSSDPGRLYGEDDLRFALDLASRAALAVDNARLYSGAQEAAGQREEALLRHRVMEEQLTLLVEASGSLSASPDLPSVLEAILALSRRLVAADAYAIWRHRPATGRWSIESSSGLSEHYQHSNISVLDRTPAPAMPQSPIVAEDVFLLPLLEDRRAAYEAEGIRSLLSVPLRIHGRVGGTLAFYYRSPHRFSDIQVRVATALCDLAGTAIGTAELYEELKTNDRRKDEFLAMLAHELRNPLSSISNAVRLARESGQPEDLSWAEDVIDRQVRNLSRLIDDLLDVSRITRGKIQLRVEDLDVSPVMTSAIEAVRPLVEARKHHISVGFPPETLWVRGDPTRVEQILTNLLTNAAKYTENGGQIHLSAGQEGPYVAFRVRDTGVGIPPEALPRMFELFAQGERTLARSEGGLGIGLTLVRKLAEMHGGTVTASSEGPGLGSEFAVRLPSAAPPPADRDRPRPSPRPSRGSRILVVDDNHDSARSLARLLRLRGHDVRVAFSGPEALDAARSHEPAFVLLDIGLPGMDGLQVARLLRAEPCCRLSVLIAVTGYGEDDTRKRARDAGFDHHLVKPVDYDELVRLLDRPDQGPSPA